MGVVKGEAGLRKKTFWTRKRVEPSARVESWEV